MQRGEILGLSESGCGKSTLGKALLRMIAPPVRSAAADHFDGQDVMEYDERQLRDFRGARRA